MVYQQLRRWMEDELGMTFGPTDDVATIGDSEAMAKDDSDAKATASDEPAQTEDG